MRGDARSKVEKFLTSFDPGAEGFESFLDAAKAPVDLRDIANLGFPISTQSGNQQGHARSNIGTGEFCSPEFIRSQNYRPVGIAENDPSTHLQESVDEKESRFKEFFMNQYRTSALGGGHQGHGGHVGRKARPGSIGNMRNRPAELFFDLEGLPFGDKDVLSLDFCADAQPTEGL